MKKFLFLCFCGFWIIIEVTFERWERQKREKKRGRDKREGDAGREAGRDGGRKEGERAVLCRKIT